MNNKYHLLVVDENPYVVEILLQTLAKDFNITVAATGQEAARLLIQGNRFDCVLTELNLSFFSGLDLTKLIRMSKLSAQTPVVILSNAPDSATRIECLEQGVDAFLSKPFNPLEVKAKLNALLRRADAPVASFQQQYVAVQHPAESRSFWPQRLRTLSSLLSDHSLSHTA